jgi:putative chitinase
MEGQMPKVVTIRGVGDIDLDKVARMLPGHQGWDILRMTTQGRYISAFVRGWDILEEYEINTPLRVAHFIGQGLIETGWLRHTVENLNYGADALQRTFSHYRNNPDLARAHARKPELIANTVYSGRMGNNQPGDGWKFRGRGFIQLTGRDNYTAIGAASGLDLVNDPDIIRNDLKASIQAAAAFWRLNKLNEHADRNDAPAVSRAVNYGNPQSRRAALHEDLRILWTNTMLSLTQSPSLIAPEDTPPGGASRKPLATGARGEEVRKLQADLDRLGFQTGGADGIFGQATRRAVVAFQHEFGLTATGQADAATLEAVAEALADPSRSQMDARIDRDTSAVFGPPE